MKPDITYAAITSNKSTNNTENLLDTYIQEIRKSIDTHNIYSKQRTRGKDTEACDNGSSDKNRQQRNN